MSLAIVIKSDVNGKKQRQATHAYATAAGNGGDGYITKHVRLRSGWHGNAVYVLRVL